LQSTEGETMGDRGFERIEDKFAGCGAAIERISW
jgi:UDP-N-acetylglucosamine enolpyruvyl transferase